MRAFCAAFSLLGLKLLFGSDRQLSFGSILLCACVSAAIASMVSVNGTEEALGGAAAWLAGAANATCASAAPGGPVGVGCALLKFS